MEYTALLEKQILGRLKVDNPWWTEGKIPSYYQAMSPRLYLDMHPAIDRRGCASTEHHLCVCGDTDL